MSTQPTATIWIERRAATLETLWGETRYHEAFTLVDTDHVPLHDEQGREYRLGTIGEAEAKIRELLAPLLGVLAGKYAERGVVS